jgi:hypothetical protein
MGEFRMRVVFGAIACALVMSPQASAMDFAALESALEAHAICSWEVRPEGETSADSVGQCDTIIEVLDVSPSALRTRETSLEPFAGYTAADPFTAYIMRLPVYAQTRQVWSDLSAFNDDQRPYLKFVTENELAYVAEHDAHCDSGPSLLSADSTRIFLSSNLEASVRQDRALPAELNRRVIQAIRTIAQDRSLQGGVRKRGGGAMIDIVNAMMSEGMCGRYNGASFGGPGEDRWEALTARGEHLELINTSMRIAPSADGLRLFPSTQP